MDIGAQLSRKESTNNSTKAKYRFKKKKKPNIGLIILDDTTCPILYEYEKMSAACQSRVRSLTKDVFKRHSAQSSPIFRG